MQMYINYSLENDFKQIQIKMPLILRSNVFENANFE